MFIKTQDAVPLANPDFLSLEDIELVSGGKIPVIESLVDPTVGEDFGDDVSTAGTILTGAGLASGNLFVGLAGLGLQAAGGAISSFFGGIVGRR
jgi:hypothetical protein